MSAPRRGPRADGRRRVCAVLLLCGGVAASVPALSATLASAGEPAMQKQRAEREEREEREERARIDAERVRLGAAFDAEAAGCRDRFFVNACLHDVQARRRAALDPLRRRELDLDDAERLRRAAARKAAVEARLREPLPPEPPPPPTSPPQPPEATPAEAPPPREAPRAGREASEAADAAEAARRAQAARKRQQQAEERRQKIRRREAERAANGKAAAPLPTPSGLPGEVPSGSRR